MRVPEHYSAIYGIVKNTEGKILFQRRTNSGFNDGILQFPSGHIEGEETYFEALKREMKEEINIEFGEQDVKLKHVMHRICKGNRVYFDIFFEIQNFTGGILNLEPEKCSELDFFDVDHTDITPYNIEVLESISNGIQLSEVIM